MAYTRTVNRDMLIETLTELWHNVLARKLTARIVAVMVDYMLDLLAKGKTNSEAIAITLAYADLLCETWTPDCVARQLHKPLI